MKNSNRKLNTSAVAILGAIKRLGNIATRENIARETKLSMATVIKWLTRLGEMNLITEIQPLPDGYRGAPPRIVSAN